MSDAAEKNPQGESVTSQQVEPKAEKYVPLWQTISGINPANEMTMDYQTRFEGIKMLIAEFERRIRHELAEAEKNAFVRKPPKPFIFIDGKTTGYIPPQYPGNIMDSGVDDDYTPCQPYPSIYWDPLLKICHELGISRTKLSRYCREAVGVAAHEMLDWVKAEKVKAALRNDVQYFAYKTLSGFRTEGKQVGYVHREDEIRWNLWRELKFKRRGPDFKSTWALRHGFPSYARFQRACILCYGKTPHQIEMEILLKIADTYVEDRKAYIEKYPKAMLHNWRACQTDMVNLFEKHMSLGGDEHNFPDFLGMPPKGTVIPKEDKILEI